MIDLHSHTTASDGSMSPEELVQHALRTELSTLAVTDHDTVAGLAAAATAAGECGIEFVPGVEVSVDYSGGELHLLGYFLDYEHPEFLSRLTYLQENRFNRNQVMLRKMHEAGFLLSMAEVEAEAGGGQIGRPHMAQALVKKGYVATVQQAFDEYLADGKPLHVPKVKLDPAGAIDLVHLAGGAAVVAHPKYLGFADESALRAELERLCSFGLDGLECFYSQHSEEETRLYLKLAREYDLVVTAGSDFHGGSKPDVPLGVVYRGAGGPDELVEPLRRAAARHSA